jgi:hypothetical protein
MKNIDPVEIHQMIHQQSKTIVKRSLYCVLEDKMTGTQKLSDLL